MLGDINSSAIIMDNESYFSLKHSTLSGNVHCYAKGKGDALGDVKFSTQRKFEQRLLVWIAISPAGISKLFFCPATSNVNKDIYVNKCVKQRLLPFIQQYHSDDRYIFWPDLATAHYANFTLETFTKLNINYIKKDLNFPVVPHLRPIENFLGMLKDKVY